MARILNPRLTITLLGEDPKVKQKAVLLTVTCQVAFSEIEDCMMKMCSKGVWYDLEAYCYGEDNPSNHAADQVLFFMRRVFFPGIDDPNNVTITWP